MLQFVRVCMTACKVRVCVTACKDDRVNFKVLKLVCASISIYPLIRIIFFTELC
jgi:hypothetical protein